MSCQLTVLESERALAVHLERSFELDLANFVYVGKMDFRTWETSSLIRSPMRPDSAQVEVEKLAPLLNAKAESLLQGLERSSKGRAKQRISFVSIP
jgi:hypothetical protein